MIVVSAYPYSRDGEISHSLAETTDLELAALVDLQGDRRPSAFPATGSRGMQYQRSCHFQAK